MSVLPLDLYQQHRASQIEICTFYGSNYERLNALALNEVSFDFYHL